MNTQKRTPAGIWRNIKYDLTVPRDMARFVARERYAWPGGYALAIVTDDGGLLCADCCKSEYYQMATSHPGDGWHAAAVTHSHEFDGAEICSHCGDAVE